MSGGEPTRQGGDLHISKRHELGGGDERRVRVGCRIFILANFPWRPEAL